MIVQADFKRCSINVYNFVAQLDFSLSVDMNYFQTTIPKGECTLWLIMVITAWKICDVCIGTYIFLKKNFQNLFSTKCRFINIFRNKTMNLSLIMNFLKSWMFRIP